MPRTSSPDWSRRGKKRSAEWLRGERHGARAAAEHILKYSKSSATLVLRDLQTSLRRCLFPEDFDRGYTRAYAETLKASPAEIQELGRPFTRAELDRDIQEALGRKR